MWKARRGTSDTSRCRPPDVIKKKQRSECASSVDTTSIAWDVSHPLGFRIRGRRSRNVSRHPVLFHHGKRHCPEARTSNAADCTLMWLLDNTRHAYCEALRTGSGSKTVQGQQRAGEFQSRVTRTREWSGHQHGKTVPLTENRSSIIYDQFARSILLVFHSRGHSRRPLVPQVAIA